MGGQPTPLAQRPAHQRLLTRGLVERHRDPRDTRRHLLELTASGRAVLDAATAPALEVDRRMVDGLTDRQAEELVHLLRLVLASGGRPVDDEDDDSVP